MQRVKGSSSGIRLQSPATVRSRFYLRLMVEDRPGVLAEIAHVLAEHHIDPARVVAIDPVALALAPVISPETFSVITGWGTPASVPVNATVMYSPPPAAVPHAVVM